MKVLLVEDSLTVAAYVSGILRAEPDIELLPVAHDAQSAVEQVLRLRPQVVLMDMMLPDHDGVWAIERIMAEAPCPVVVLSGYLDAKDRDVTFESLRAGAVDVLAKPGLLPGDNRERFAAHLVRTLRLMASAVVVRRRRPIAQGTPFPSAATAALPERVRSVAGVAIGASTGGPALIYKLLAGLPAPLPFPVLLGQHTLEGFDESLARWLCGTGHRVEVAPEGARPNAGTVYLAPADRLLELSAANLLNSAPMTSTGSLRSIDHLFHSVARTWGAYALGVLLTGMGRDGADGLLAMRRAGAVTVAQSQESCVVSSMPDSARAIDAVSVSLGPEEITELLSRLAQTDPQGSASTRQGD